MSFKIHISNPLLIIILYNIQEKLFAGANVRSVQDNCMISTKATIVCLPKSTPTNPHKDTHTHTHTCTHIVLMFILLIHVKDKPLATFIPQTLNMILRITFLAFQMCKIFNHLRYLTRKSVSGIGHWDKGRVQHFGKYAYLQKWKKYSETVLE